MRSAIHKRYAAAMLACLLGCAAGLAWSAPGTVKASYNGFMNGLPIGVINEQFQIEGASYRIESDTKPTGIAALLRKQPLRFSSAGRMTREGLRPSQFEARRSAGENPQVSATFDWGKRQLLLNHAGKSEILPIISGTQDRLSVMYQLMFWPVGRMNTLEFSMTNGRKLDHYRYVVTPDVELDTPLGRLKTLHLVKDREPGETGNELWLSTQHRYFPVKIVYLEKGGVRYEQVIQSLEIRD